MTPSPDLFARTGGAGAHDGQRIARLGPPVAEAAGVLILAHGRGGSGADMLGLARALVGAEIACLAPEAAGHAWYPNRFMEPVGANEPYLTSGLWMLADLVARVIAAGVSAERIALGGFSQGACLALEFTARHDTRLGAVLGFSGGLIGETVGPYPPSDKLAGLPVFLGCSERDPHIPAARVQESAAALGALGAAVTTWLYPGSGHGVVDDEVAQTQRLLTRIFTVDR